MSYLQHFETELNIMRDGLDEGDDLIITPYIDVIKQIIEVHSDEGHSGGSNGYAVGCLSETIKRVLKYEPLSPLTGKDSEWISLDYGDDMKAQNNRRSAVFKGVDDKCYFIDAVVFQRKGTYDSFTGTVEGIRSRQFIKEFPFTPKTFYIDVYREEYDADKHGVDCDYTQCGDGDYVYFISDMDQMNEVWEYYEKPE